MIDTKDLTSYIPGYERYLDEIEKANKHEDLYDFSDELYEEFMLRKEIEKMERKVIDLNNTNMNFDEIMALENYVWKSDKLIPVELLEGE